jgi:NADPH-dependent curcumin reductase CurA
MGHKRRRIVLNGPIAGKPTPADFRLVEDELPPLDEGHILFRIRHASVDPGVRSRLSGGDSYSAALKPGETIDGFSIGEVLESRHPKWSVGDLAALGAGWCDRFVSDGKGYLQRIADPRPPLTAWIGVLGVPGMTAWFGLHRVAQAKEGETLVVTSAAGPVGATAGQIGKKLGMRVIGVAGGAEKCAWLTDACGFDAAIDRHATPDLTAAIAAAAPKGIDVLFDNVGAASIDMVLPLMRPRGRIVVSGQVADYSTPSAERVGLKQTDRFITHRLRMEGLVVFDDIRGFADAQATMAGWIADGTLKFKEIRAEGLEALPKTFCALFESDAAFGRRIVDV